MLRTILKAGLIDINESRKERIKHRHWLWRQKNKEKLRLKAKDNRERQKGYELKYRQKNREKRNEYFRKYNKTPYRREYLTMKLREYRAKSRNRQGRVSGRDVVQASKGGGNLKEIQALL